ncbi:MAG: hypothetical protein J3K34DRAFT_403071, partial [Monoraphidium minutum]
MNAPLCVPIRCARRPCPLALEASHLSGGGPRTCALATPVVPPPWEQPSRANGLAAHAAPRACPGAARLAPFAEGVWQAGGQLSVEPRAAPGAPRAALSVCMEGPLHSAHPEFVALETTPPERRPNNALPLPSPLRAAAAATSMGAPRRWPRRGGARHGGRRLPRHRRRHMTVFPC